MTAHVEMSCQELVEFVSDYLDGALDAAARARVEAHLAGCEGCEAYIDQMRATLRLLGGVPSDPLPATACEHLLEVFRTWRGRGS